MTVEAAKLTVDVRPMAAASPTEARSQQGTIESVTPGQGVTRQSAAIQAAGSSHSGPGDEGVAPRPKATEAARAGPVRLDYEVDEDTRRVVVSIVDRASGEVLKQIPPEQLLNTLARLVEYVGQIVDEEV